MNIKTLDLNLLKTFDALYQEKHVGKAGVRLGLAQPSVSNALARLRDRFDDPLFQRGPEGMVPTAKAEILAPQVREALHLIESLFAPDTFDPMTVEADVTVAAADVTVMRLAPRLLSQLSDTAPNLRLRFQPLGKLDVIQALDDEALTLAIGAFGVLPARFHRQKIMTDRFVCISSRDHKELQNGLTIERFVEMRHALFTLSNDTRGAVDKALKSLGRSRNVVLTCTQFLTLPDIITGSDLIATIPASLSAFAERAGCQVFEPPLELPEWSIEAVWTQKTNSSALGRFIVDKVLVESKD